MRSPLIGHLPFLAPVLAAACAASPPGDGLGPEWTSGAPATGAASATGGVTSGSHGTSAGSQGDGSGTAGETGSTGEASTSGFKFDVGVGTGGPTGCDPLTEACACDGVDVLFVVDNSASMYGAQQSLAEAFPKLVDAMVEGLPLGTSLHVGVTTTQFEYSSVGTNDYKTCEATGEQDAPAADFFIPPDVMNNGFDGAQGRLRKVDGKSFFAATTDDASAIADLKVWFSSAAAAGADGSNVEFPGAAAGFVAHPANAAANAGFLRDAGTVLVLFVVTNELDQTPATLDGKPAGQALLDLLATAKADCGGLSCVVGGGVVETSACLDGSPLGTIFDNLGAPAVLHDFTMPNLLDPTAQDFIQVFQDTLAGVITQKCEEIPPVG